MNTEVPTSLHLSLSWKRGLLGTVVSSAICVLDCGAANAQGGPGVWMGLGKTGN